MKKYSIFWVAGERDGEILFQTDDKADAINKAYELSEKYEEEFDPLCGGIAIFDEEKGEIIEW